MIQKIKMFVNKYALISTFLARAMEKYKNKIFMKLVAINKK